MPKDRWIAYVGPFSFPWGQPGSRRVFGVASALRDSGYKVVVGSGQWGAEGDFALQNSEGIGYVNLCDLPSPGATTNEKLIQLFYQSGQNTVKWLDSLSNKPSYVFVYGAGAPFMRRILNWGKAKNIPVIADVVEWYDGSHMTGGHLGPFHISAKIAMHYYFPRCNGIVAISTLLESHFRSTVDSVLRVPPILDLSLVSAGCDRVPLSSSNGRINLVYAGTPGKKDLLATVIRGIAAVDPSGDRFHLAVMGPTEEQAVRLLGNQPIPGFVDVLGMLPQTEVADRLQQADFSVLLRESKRFANAGFSTKFVESYANGVPVIANLTSDISLYLRDGIDGVICADHTELAFSNALRRISEMTPVQLRNMRYAAREQAVKSFDYRNYLQEISSFLLSVRK